MTLELYHPESTDERSHARIHTPWGRTAEQALSRSYPKTRESDVPMHGTCKHCGKPIVGARHKMKEDTIESVIEIWTHQLGKAQKTACADGKHNAEPDES